MDAKKLELKQQIAKDRKMLDSLLKEPLANGDHLRTREVLRGFMGRQADGVVPYSGLVILDKDKKVFEANMFGGDPKSSKWIGVSYSGVTFQEIKGSVHRFLTPFRADESHPMGHQGVELAFEIKKDQAAVGWLIFQMNLGMVKRVFGVDEKGLKKFVFDGP